MASLANDRNNFVAGWPRFARKHREQATLASNHGLVIDRDLEESFLRTHLEVSLHVQLLLDMSRETRGSFRVVSSVAVSDRNIHGVNASNHSKAGGIR